MNQNQSPNLGDLPTLAEITDLFKVLCTVELDEEATSGPSFEARVARDQGLRAVSTYFHALDRVAKQVIHHHM